MEKQKMLMIGQGATIPLQDLASRYLFRATHTDIALAEKVLMFDDDLDDRYIEMCKLWVCHSLVTGYAEILQRLSAGQPNAAALLYGGIQRPPEGAPRDTKPQLRFVYALPHQAIGALTIIVPQEIYFAAADVVARAADRMDQPGIWHTVDFSWAQANSPAEIERPSIEVLVDPMGAMAHPIIETLVADAEATKAETPPAGSTQATESTQTTESPQKTVETAEISEPVGRNQPCPCGSGNKYKHCHGSLA